jgi:hypothetical protein
MELPSAIAFDLGDTLCEYAGVPLDWQLLRLFFEHFRPMSRVAEQDGTICSAGSCILRASWRTLPSS